MCNVGYLLKSSPFVSFFSFGAVAFMTRATKSSHHLYY